MKLSELHNMIPLYPNEKLIEILVNIRNMKKNKTNKILTELQLNEIVSKIMQVLNDRCIRNFNKISY